MGCCPKVEKRMEFEELDAEEKEVLAKRFGIGKEEFDEIKRMIRELEFIDRREF